jgi:hypothetical protein
MALAGKEILMGSEAELGPLDVQIWDEETQERHSALEAVQSFERLNEYGLDAFDRAMHLLIGRMQNKPPIVLMLQAVQYATGIVGPTRRQD